MSTYQITPLDKNTRTIHYSRQPTPWGEVIVASSGKGICFLGFEDSHQEATKLLKQRLGDFLFEQHEEIIHRDALTHFLHQTDYDYLFCLHGSRFQLHIWAQLLQIPFGKSCTYKELATAAGYPRGARAAGNANGKNPVSLLIPCHRVVQSNGAIGGYHWGKERKERILSWERIGITPSTGL